MFRVTQLRPATSYLLLLLLALLVPSATANTEKAIFTGPSTRPVPADPPTLDDLQLPELSPRHWALRTHLAAAFPTEASKYGTSSWVLLQGLNEGQRYEVRVCWAATEPTSFRLDTYELPAVFETPELISSLAEYAESERPDPIALEEHKPSIFIPSHGSKKTDDNEVSVLFLRIQAAADYYTTNRALMENVPPVYVDIILDPYLFNVLPRSLVPTAVYIILLAIGSGFIAKYVSGWIQSLPSKDVGSEKKTT